ncbi:DFNB59 [Branchiostoma lanceolatum]|uniref:DFNB59 protein n=1 Tax=Branchiostoma lanceolatum TaxID=7740 RepID=A0A8J9YRQ9_BRALA|nr:DFNB59 [Branchiostoma lanceolatum]CAH1239332.1 DFNB59 [Branchiostoma lanceolatum]
MFEAAVSGFVKAVGKDSLLPVPDLNSADKCRPLHVAVKKNPKWFWQSARYLPTSFKIHQILTKTEEIDVKVDCRTLVEYNKTSHFSVKGSVGSKILKEVDLDVSGSGMVSIKASFGKVNKCDVDVPTLMQALEKRFVDFRHDFVNEVRQNPRNVLCVVVGTACTINPSVLSSEEDVEGNQKATIALGTTANINEEGEISNEVDKVFDLPPATPLAYNVCEILVKEDGGIDLQYTRDGNGGFATKPGAGVVQPDAPPNTELGYTMKPLLSMPEQKRNSVTSAVLKVMEAPADIPLVEELLDDVVDGRKPKPFAEFKSKCTNPSAVLAFLSTIDFQMDTPFTDEDKALIHSLDALFDGLVELSDEQCLALKECNANFAPALLHVLAQGIAGNPVPLDDPAISILYVKSNNPGQDFIEAMDFGIQDVGSKKSLVTEDNGKMLYAAQQAVYGLWGGL